LSFVPWALAFFLTGVNAQAIAPIAPSDLQTSYRAFLEADARDKDNACNILIDAYMPLLRKGMDDGGVDKAIVDYLSFESRAALAAQLAIQGIFSPLQEACITRDDAESASSFQDELDLSAKGLYLGLKRLAGPGAIPLSAWKEIAGGLRRGWHDFPSPLYADRLEDAFRKAHDRRGLFEFKAYRYFDESGPNPLRDVALFVRWLFLPGRKSFRDEIAAVKRSIKDDIMRTSPPVAGLPVFGGEMFRNSAGVSRLLSFSRLDSELHGKRAVFAFFQTTCGYCVDELSALDKLAPDLVKKSRGGVAVIGVKTPSNLPAALSALAPFEKSLAIHFPLVENDASNISTAYRVRSVPLLIFFDERGVPLWTVTLRGQGRLEEKLSWFLDDFLADAGRAQQPAAAAQAPAVPADVYFDPSVADAQSFIDKDIPALARLSGRSLRITSHDIRAEGMVNALDDRLAGLREIRSELPVFIIGGRTLQGLSAIRADLPAAIRSYGHPSR